MSSRPPPIQAKPASPAAEKAPAPDTGRPTKADVVKEFREREIVEAARRVFTREGFKKASMEKIAEEAGLAKGTVYLYFPNKDQLISHTVEEGAGRFFGESQERSAAGRTPAEKLRLLVEAMFEHAEEERDFQRALFVELNEWLFDTERRSIVDRLIARHDQFMNYIAGIIAEGVSAGEFRAPDPRRAAGYLYHLLGGLFRERLMGISDEPVSQTAGDLYRFFMQALTSKELRP